MNQEYSILKKCPLFADMIESDYTFILSCLNAYTKHYLPSEYILLAGNQVNYVGIVLTGSLALLKENPAGLKHILDFIGPSEMFGEGIACTKSRISSVTVVAKEASDVICIPYERIIKTCYHSCTFHHQIIKNMLMLLGEKNSILNHKIELLALKGMREKLATYLLYESKKHNSLTFQIIPNRNELAEYLNVSRCAMSRELGRLKELGMIDYYKNSFKILLPDELAKCLL